MMNQLFFQPLAQVAPGDLGGKASGLYRLWKSGYKNIPPTYVIPLSSIRNFLSAFLTYPRLITLARNPGNQAELDQSIREFAAECHEKVAESAKSPELKRIIEKLGSDLIVRSSCSHEDRQTASSAGIFLSIHLCDATPMILDQALADLISGSFTSETIVLLLSQGIDPANHLPGLIVQPFIVAAYAGVVFGIDPRDPWKKCGVINYSGKNPEAVTAGSGQTRTIVEGLVDDKAPRRMAFISKELFAITRCLQKKFAIPLDLEWIDDGKKLFIVQVRPIADETVGLSFRTRKGRKWSRKDTAERFPEAMTPMGFTSILGSFRTNLGVLEGEFGIVPRHPDDVAILHQGYVYADPFFFSFPKGIGIRWSFLLNPFGQPFRAILATLIEIPRMIFENIPKKIFFAFFLVDQLFDRPARNILIKWQERTLSFRDSVEQLQGRIASSPSKKPEILLSLAAELSQLTDRLLEQDLPIFLIKENLSGKLLNLFTTITHDPPERFYKMIGSPADCWSIRIKKAIERLSDLIEADPEGLSLLDLLNQGSVPVKAADLPGFLRTATKSAWLNFIEDFGFAVDSFDVARPTWRENPSTLSALFQPAKKAVVSKPNSFEQERLKSIELFLAGLPKRRQRSIEKTIERIRSFIVIDEEQHYLSGMLIFLTRRLLDAFAHFFITAGLIEKPDDIYYLTIDEVKGLARQPFPTMTYLVEHRRSLDLIRRKSTPSFTLPPEQKIERETSDETILLIAEPMSTGKATGKVFLYLEGETFERIPRDCILVCPSPIPTLAALYPRISGLVCESGSLLSHGFVTAREYCLPAIANARGIRDLVKNGDRIEIDGSNGSIRRIDEGKTRITGGKADSFYLLLDLDGTLIDYERIRSHLAFIWQVALCLGREFGLFRAMKALKASRRAIEDETRPGRLNATRAIEAIADHLGLDYEEAERVYRRVSLTSFSKVESHFRMNPLVPPFIAWAQKHFRLVIATNPMWIEPIVDLRLSWAGIDPALFHFKTHADNMHHIKSSPRYFEELLGQLNIVADRAIMIGDNPEKDGLAIDFGITTYLIGTTKFAPIQPPKKTADLIQVADFASLKTALKNRFPTICGD